MWTKLDDGILDHPKIATLDAVGFGWFVAGLAYVNRALTDGFIPQSVAERLLPLTRHDQDGEPHTLVSAPSKWVSDDGETRGGAVRLGLVNTTIDALLAAGLWDEVAGGYQVHDFLAYNLSKDQVLAKRNRARVRQSRHRHGVTDDEVTRESRPRHSAPAPAPAPSPDPSPDVLPVRSSNGTDTSAHTSRRKTRRDPVVAITPEVMSPENGTALSPETGSRSQSFEALWTQYPRHEAKKDARAAWNDVAGNLFLLARIEAALGWQRETEQWRAGKIPHLHRYLRKRRWEDEPPPPPPPGGTKMQRTIQALGRLAAGRAKETE